MSAGRPDYSPTAVDVILRPEWAAVRSLDKAFDLFQATLAPGGYLSIFYTVPTGKTLYLVQFATAAIASALADSEKNHIVWGSVFDTNTTTHLWTQAGQGGFGVVLAKPIVIPAGHLLELTLYNPNNHNCNVSITAAGYEE